MLRTMWCIAAGGAICTRRPTGRLGRRNQCCGTHEAIHAIATCCCSPTAASTHGPYGAFTLARLRLNRAALVAHRARRVSQAAEQGLLERYRALLTLLECSNVTRLCSRII